MLIAAGRTIAVVTHSKLQTGVEMGGRVVVTTNLTGGWPIEVPKSVFEQIADSLRPHEEFRKAQYDFDDGYRVAKWLKGKPVMVRREVHGNGSPATIVDSIMGVADDESLQRFQRVSGKAADIKVAKHQKGNHRRTRERRPVSV